MTKSLKDLFEVYRPKAKDEQDFVDKHVAIKHKDRNGNGDDVFKGNTKYNKRKEERHGYDVGEDEKVYEETEKQHIEVTSHTGHRKLVPVHPTNAFRALNHYKGLVSTKSARIVSEEVEDLDEGLGDTIKKGVKAFKRGMKGWEKGMHDVDTVKAANKTLSPDDKERILKNKVNKGSPAELQQKLIKREKNLVKEGIMKLSKVHIVHHHDHPAAKEFAKNYTEGMKRDHREGGPTEKDEKASDKFHSRYSTVYAKHGFAGSGTTIYHDHKTGAKWRIDRHPNGKTFYGTDHIISHHVGDIHESVESDYSFTEDEDKVIRSLAGAAEELGEELDLETLAGIAEEVLSELSVDTLKSYRTKARADAYDADDVTEGVKEKIKGVIRREKAKDMPLVQTRRDYAMMKALDSYEKGNLRKGNQYNAWAERDRKKQGAPTTNPAGTYRTKTSDYTNEAKDQIDAASWRSGYNAAKPNDPKSGKVIAAKERQLSKRHGGIELAVKKLTKEDIINKAIETYIPEGVELPSLQERLVDKLDEHNLSEAHIHILLSMFDSLNEQNQTRMLDRVTTLEDVNSLLDFAITNRGD